MVLPPLTGDFWMAADDMHCVVFVGFFPAFALEAECVQAAAESVQEV